LKITVNITHSVSNQSHYVYFTSVPPMINSPYGKYMRHLNPMIAKSTSQTAIN